MLLYKHVFDSAEECPADLSDVTENIFEKKCDEPLLLLQAAI